MLNEDTREKARKVLDEEIRPRLQADGGDVELVELTDEGVGWATFLYETAQFKYVALLLIGGIIIRNTVGVPALFRPGVTFCVKKILRLGIILLGIRLSLVDVLKISASALPLVVLIGGLVSVGVARTKPRDGRFARLVPGLGLFVVQHRPLLQALLRRGLFRA